MNMRLPTNNALVLSHFITKVRNEMFVQLEALLGKLLNRTH